MNKFIAERVGVIITAQQTQATEVRAQSKALVQ